MSEPIPESWASTSLGQVCEPPMYGWTTRAASSPRGVRFLRTTDISHGPVNWGSVPGCDEEPDDLGKYALRSGDLVISRAGSVGLSALIEDCPPAVFASYLIRFRPHAGVEPRYLKWYLQSATYWEQIREASAGIALQNVNARKLAAVELPLAPLAEQRRIVAALEEHLSDLDAAVAGLERARANVRRYTGAILQAAVQGELTLTASASSWEDVALDQLVAPGRKCAYGVLQPGPDVPDGVPLVRVGDIDDGRVALDSLKRIAPSIAVAYPRTRLRGGELLITLVGTIGRTAVAPHDLAGANTARAVGVVPLGPRVRAEWVNIWFRSPNVLARMNATAHEVARKTLNLEDVRAARVALPPLDEQDAIIAEVDRLLAAADRTATDIEVQLARAVRLRQSILQRAFSGRLVPQDPSDEPAAELLARIRAVPANKPTARPRVARSRASSTRHVS